MIRLDSFRRGGLGDLQAVATHGATPEGSPTNGRRKQAVRRTRNRQSQRRLMIEGLEGRNLLANLAPVDLTMSGGKVLENSAVGTEVAQLLAIDPDAGDTFSYSLVTGSGDTDNGRFSVQSNRLVAQGPFDYELQHLLHVRLRGTDAGGLSVDRPFTITVLDLDDLAPSNSMTSVTQAEPEYYVELGGRVDTINEQSVSADGRVYVFAATGRNLASSQFDQTSNLDVYVYDRTDNTLNLVSHGVDAPNSSADGDSRNPRVSADGQFVAFESTAGNLVVGQSVPTGPQIYLYEVATGAITLVSRANTAATTPSNGTTQLSGISDDGGKVVFASNSTNLLAGQVDSNANDDVFLYDRGSNAVRLVSHSTSNSQTAAANRSGSAQVSGDGLWVVYTSLANNLATGITDANAQEDVWLYNVATAQNSLVSHASTSATTTANGGSFLPVISASGGVVAFESAATNLVAAQSDANGARDIFRYARATNSSILVSHANALANTAGNGLSTAPALSGDGQFLAYQSTAKNLTPGLAATKTRTDDDVFVFSIGDGLTVLVSHNSANSANAGNGRSWQPSISDDGQYIAYLSQASDLIDGGVDANGVQSDAMVYDLVADASGLANRSADDSLMSANANADSAVMAGQGEYAYFTSFGSDLASPILDNLGTRDVFNFNVTSGFVDPSDLSDVLSPATTSTGGGSSQFSGYAASDDDRYWVFTSPGIDLVSGTIGTPPTLGSGPNQVYVFDRFTFGKSLVSHAAGEISTVAGGDSTDPMIAADGSFVVFRGTGTNLVTGLVDNNTAGDVFLYDLATGLITVVSHQSASSSTTANGVSRPLAISQDGQYVLFASTATNLVAGQIDTNGGEDLFLFDRLTGTVTLVTHTAGPTSTTANAPTSVATMSADGQFVAYSTNATNLTAGQSDLVGTSDVFLYDAVTKSSSLISHATTSSSLSGNGISTVPRISKFGDTLAFLSNATNLVSGQADTNGGGDVYLYNFISNTLSLASHVPGNALQTGNGVGQDLAISGDGQFVAYSSLATNLVTGLTDSNSAADIFLFDSVFNETSLVTRKPGLVATTAGGGGIGALAISDDGRYVIYDTTMTGLVAPLPGGAGSREVYQFDSANNLTLLATTRPVGATAKTSRVTGVGASGEWIGLTSDSDLLVDWDFNSLGDFFIWSTPFDPPNAVPTDITLSPSQVHEQRPIGTMVGTLGTSDLDVADTFTYELTSGPGGDDNGFFTLTGSLLSTNSVFSQAAKSSYQVRIRSTDNSGDFVEKALVVRITGDFNGPTDMSLSRTDVFEMRRSATVGVVTVVNPDSGATHQLTVSDSRFTFAGNTLKLKPNEFLNRTNATTVTLQITATDSAVPPNTFSKQFVLNVLANPTPWRNPLNGLDVFPDTFVAPQDALIIINELNAVGPHQLIPPVENEAPPPPYLDSDGDNFVAPIDALLIINFLNLQSGSEGEDVSTFSPVMVSPAAVSAPRSIGARSLLASNDRPASLSSLAFDATIVAPAAATKLDMPLNDVEEEAEVAWDELLNDLAADR